MTHHRKHASLPHAGPGKPTSLWDGSGDTGRGGKPAIHEDIQLNAYQKWEAAGQPAGDGVPFWLDAEQELAQGK